MIGVFQRFIGVFIVFLAISSLAEARGGGLREEYLMISNGQGVSSPSFWDGLSGENPAGLVNNHSLKIQTAGATFDDSTKNIHESAALLYGNGLFGAGMEYANFNASPYPAGAAQINWGVAGRFSSIHTAFGVSGRHSSISTRSYYDFGALIGLFQRVTMGLQVPDFGGKGGPQVVASGFTVMLHPMLDFVVDAAVHLRSHHGTVKPGITLRTDRVMATGAYGLDFAGNTDVLLNSKLTAGLGIKVTEYVFIEYEYRGMPQHRVGLTLRLN